MQYVLHKGTVECPICHKKGGAPVTPPTQVDYYPQREELGITIDNRMYMVQIPHEIHIRRAGTHRLSAARFVLCTGLAIVIIVLVYTFR